MTCPHRQPQGNRFERVNGWQSLRMVAPRRIGLPYGVYPRLLLMFITTEAVRKKTREIHLGVTPNDLARKLGLSTISGPRGTAPRLEAQVRKLISTTWRWQSADPTSHFAVSRRSAPTVAPALRTLAARLGLAGASWRTYRMSYLRRPTLVPWKGLQAQLGADYARPRDFRRIALARLEDVVAAYPELRLRGEDEGLRLYPSPPQVTRQPR